MTINGQTGGILPVLVFGAGTDYALLPVSRYREELRRHEDKHEAMAIALRGASPAILASGLTVIAALLTLSIAEVNSTAGLGPVGAMGVGLAMISMLTVLPALLVVSAGEGEAGVQLAVTFKGDPYASSTMDTIPRRARSCATPAGRPRWSAGRRRRSTTCGCRPRATTG